MSKIRRMIMSNTHELEFEEALSDTDFGLIVCGKTGKLKGLWIPTELKNEPVPDTIVDMCVKIFGVDPKEFEDDERPSILH